MYGVVLTQYQIENDERFATIVNDKLVGINKKEPSQVHSASIGVRMKVRTQSSSVVSIEVTISMKIERGQDANLKSYTFTTVRQERRRKKKTTRLYVKEETVKHIKSWG